MRLAKILRAAAAAVAAAVTALAPFYGKAHWFVVLVAVSSVLALVAPSLLGSSSPSSPSSSTGTGGRLQAGGQ